jgi:hypothetical protein
MEIRSSVEERLLESMKAERLRCGMSHKAIAVHFGCGMQVIKNIEKGIISRKGITAEMCIQWLQHLPDNDRLTKPKVEVHDYECPCCGKAFRKKYDERYPERFCSKPCSVKVRDHRAQGELQRINGQVDRLRDAIVSDKYPINIIDLFPMKECQWCLFMFPGRGMHCSSGCALSRNLYQKRAVNTRSCVVCDTDIPTIRKNVKTCCEDCAYAFHRRGKNDAKSIRRARLASGESFKSAEIFMRDGYVCQICKKKTKPNVHSNHDLYPTIDHITPLVIGGKHERRNVQCAHRICNSIKSDGSANDQLLLFG